MWIGFEVKADWRLIVPCKKRERESFLIKTTSRDAMILKCDLKGKSTVKTSGELSGEWGLFFMDF